MKIFKSRIFWFLIGFILGPIVIVESFGYYTQWRIAQIDAENAKTPAAGFLNPDRK